MGFRGLEPQFCFGVSTKTNVVLLRKCDKSHPIISTAPNEIPIEIYTIK